MSTNITPSEAAREPQFEIVTTDGSRETVDGASLADALRRFYDTHSGGATVVSITRCDDPSAVPDTTTVYRLDVCEVSDLDATLAASLIEHDISPNVSVDPDGEEWALRVEIIGLPSNTPGPLRALVAAELDGNWNLACGSLEQMNHVARAWSARQEHLHPGLVVTRP